MKKIEEILIKLKDWKFIILIVLIIGGVFYWSEIRPNLEKRNCYDKATEKAIEINREEKAKPYLYDRDHWKDYKKYNTISGQYSFIAELNNITGNSKPAFPENLATGIEPVYIQENLDRIAKENNFKKDDYDIYYKMCLQSKGL